MKSMWTIGNAECSPAKIHGVSTKSSWRVLMESLWSLWERVGECKVLPAGETRLEYRFQAG